MDPVSTSKAAQLSTLGSEFGQGNGTYERREQYIVVAEVCRDDEVVRTDTREETELVGSNETRSWKHEKKVDRCDRKQLHGHLAIVTPFDSPTRMVLVPQHSDKETKTENDNGKDGQKIVRGIIEQRHRWHGQDAQEAVAEGLTVVDWYIAWQNEVHGEVEHRRVHRNNSQGKVV